MTEKRARAIEYVEWDPEETKWLTRKGELIVQIMFTGEGNLGYKGHWIIPDFHMKLKISEIETISGDYVPPWIEDLLGHLAEAAVNWRVKE